MNQDLLLILLWFCSYWLKLKFLCDVLVSLELFKIKLWLTSWGCHSLLSHKLWMLWCLSKQKCSAGSGGVLDLA